MPTPPQTTTHIHPKNDIIAITYTAKDAYISKVVSLSVWFIVQLLKSADKEPTLSEEIECTGKSTNLKNAHEIKSKRTDTMFAARV